MRLTLEGTTGGVSAVASPRAQTFARYRQGFALPSMRHTKTPSPQRVSEIATPFFGGVLNFEHTHTVDEGSQPDLPPVLGRRVQFWTDAL